VQGTHFFPVFFFPVFFFVFLLEKTVLNLNYDCDLKESDIGD